MALPLVDLRALAPGAHLCRFYDDGRELAEGAATFVAHGLAAGHRVLYVAHDREPTQVEASLQVYGIRVERALADGQLVIRRPTGSFGNGATQLGQLAADYRSLSGDAQHAGLAGLRVAAEMGDAVTQLGSVEDLARWEAAAGRVQRETGVVTLCQYDRRQFSAPELQLLESRHSGRAPRGASPLPLAAFYSNRAGLRIVGELDVSNTTQLLSVVRSRLTVQPHLRLDLTDLGFADVDTLRSLFELVLLAQDIELTLCNLTALVRRAVELGGLWHPRVVMA